MATWEEMLSANYSPIDSLRQLSARRRADERRAAGLNIPTQNNQFRQFDAPTVINDSAAWIESQQDVAEQLWGTAPEVAEEEIISEEGAFTSAIDDNRASGDIGDGGYSGVGGAQFGDLPGGTLSPMAAALLGPALTGITQGFLDQKTKVFNNNSEEENSLLDDMMGWSAGTAEGMTAGELTGMSNEAIGGLPESSMEGVGLPQGFGPSQQESDNPGSTGGDGGDNGDGPNGGIGGGGGSPGGGPDSAGW